jgi:hypothetical protein
MGLSSRRSNTVAVSRQGGFMQRCTFVVLLVLAAMPSGLFAQEQDVESARYEAAITWVNLVVVEGEFEKAAAQAHEAVAAQMTTTRASTRRVEVA